MPDTTENEFPDFLTRFLCLVNTDHGVLFIAKLQGIIKVTEEELGIIDELNMVGALSIVPVLWFDNPPAPIQGFCHGEPRLFHRVSHFWIRFATEKHFRVWPLDRMLYRGRTQPPSLPRREAGNETKLERIGPQHRQLNGCRSLPEEIAGADRGCYAEPPRIHAHGSEN